MRRACAAGNGGRRLSVHGDVQRRGHDAVNLSCVAPSAMVFVPCKAGLSHNEAEEADPVHLAQGASVLANLLADCAR